MLLFNLLFFIMMTNTDLKQIYLQISKEIYNVNTNMEPFTLIAPCHFGLEAVLKREIRDLGYEIIQVEDGKVTFTGDAAAICRANIFLRELRHCHGSSGFRKTDGSGLPKPPPSKASCSALPISSLS